MKFLNQFQQKNRKRAIHITDIAIDKVPQTHILGFDKEQNKHIQTLHKLVLKEAKNLNQLYNTNEMEAGILVDIHSWEHFLIKGQRPREVELKNNLEAYKKLICGYKNNSGTIAIKEILKNADKYGLIYKKGRNSI